MVIFLCVVTLFSSNLLGMNGDIRLGQVAEGIIVHPDHGTVVGNCEFLSATFEDPITNARLQGENSLPFLIAVIAEPVKTARASTMHYYFSLDTILGLRKAENPLTRHAIVNDIQIYAIWSGERPLGIIPGHLWAVNVAKMPASGLSQHVALGPVQMRLHLIQALLKKGLEHQKSVPWKSMLRSLRTHPTLLESARQEALQSNSTVSFVHFKVELETVRAVLELEKLEIYDAEKSLNKKRALWATRLERVEKASARLKSLLKDSGND